MVYLNNLKKYFHKKLNLFFIPLSDLSSINIISSINSKGLRLIIECNVRNNVLNASLWKTIIIETVGNTKPFNVSPVTLHLKKNILKIKTIK